jgi:hypothetical protein
MRVQSPQMIVCILTAAAPCHGGVYADWQCPTAINDCTANSASVIEVCRFHSKERYFQDRLSARPEMRHRFYGPASHTTPVPQQLSNRSIHSWAYLDATSDQLYCFRTASILKNNSDPTRRTFTVTRHKIGTVVQNSRGGPSAHQKNCVFTSLPTRLLFSI